MSYTKTDTKGRVKMDMGYFSPSRLKTLEACPWQYELKYHKKIYPDQPIIEPHSQLGSAMHDFAEKYDGKKDKRQLALLRYQALKAYVLTEKQTEELDFMIHNLIENIWPELEGKGEEPFEIESIGKEVSVKGDVLTPNEDGAMRVLPLNMKIDRLIKRKDGKVIIADYKKGQPNVASHMFQLLFYAHFYSQKSRMPVDNIDIWLIFPNESKSWVKKITGAELSEHVKS
ncbi:MAG: PD-(D/E)XK nuclease family protein, partial [Actinobacteria bacterium]|nr:PD-(D/E)XK nuclease family protein [Actinomycetota bacterium]